MFLPCRYATPNAPPNVPAQPATIIISQRDAKIINQPARTRRAHTHTHTQLTVHKRVWSKWNLWRESTHAICSSEEISKNETRKIPEQRSIVNGKKEI